MKRKIFIILAIIGFSISILFTYAIFYSISHAEPSGFKRIFVDVNLSIIAEYELPSQDFGILANNSRETWLHDYKNSMGFKKIPYPYTKSTDIHVNPPSGFGTRRSGLDADLLDSTIFIKNKLDNMLKVTGDHIENYTIPYAKTNDIKVISNSSVVTKFYGQDTTGNFTSLIKLSLRDGCTVEAKYTLPKQIDGIFCADGKMFYDKNSSKFFYMYFYRGVFVCLDSNLQVLYKAKTVDTIQFADIQVTKSLFQTEDKKSRSKAWIKRPKIVNRHLSIYNDHVYIASNLLSENEDRHSKKESIDVYSIKDGKYEYSILVPRYKHYRMRQFNVKGRLLFALYGNHLVTYRFK